MRRWMFMAASLLLCSGAASLFAEDKVTVEAKSETASEGLDLKAVANLFGEVKDLEEFEQKLNSDSLHLCNLDINGDDKVDYLRVVETKDDNDCHDVLIQAVLAKDIYQDVATIHVEKGDKNEMLVKLVGDVKLYGKNYVVEPVYIYRPVIYDWFWGPAWVCYTSPWYWGYWPVWYAPYPCWAPHRYWTHVYVYHYDHPRCSYNTVSTHAPRITASQTRNYSSRPTMTYSTYAPSRTSSSRASATSSRGASSYSGSTSSSRGTSSYSGSSSSSRGASSYSGSTSSSRGASSYSGSTSSYSGSTRSSSYTPSSMSSSRGSSSYSGSSGSSRGASSYGGGSSYSGGSSSGYSGGSRR